MKMYFNLMHIQINEVTRFKKSSWWRFCDVLWATIADSKGAIFAYWEFIYKHFMIIRTITGL